MNQKPRKILIFSLVYYPLNVGGAEVAVKEIIDRISPAEVVFDMITLNGGGESASGCVGAVNVHRLFNKVGPIQKLLYPFAAYKLAKKLHAQNSYDATWAIMASYGGYAAYKFKNKNPKVPMVLTIQEGDNFGRRQGIFKSAFMRIFRAADHIQVISNFLAEWSVDMGATCPIDVVPNGVDYEHFSKPVSTDRREALRRECGFGATDTVMVTASRLVFKNAVDNIIRSLAELDSSFKLLILGTGTDEAKLRALAAELKVTDRVVFKGFVLHSNLPAYLQASEIFVRPSRTEGLGNSFLEAMAAGIPVIATPVGGIPDFLTDGETGLMCEVDNPRSIAQKAVKLARDKESRDYIVNTARNMVREKYQWAAIAAKMKDIFQK